MPLYHPFNNQPGFRWDLPKLSKSLGAIRQRQGRLLGKIEVLGSAFPVNIDSTVQGYDQLLTEERLLDWHGGPWRNSNTAHARVVHHSLPDAPVLRAEIRKFLNWFNLDGGIDPLLKAAIAHLWFMVIQPFERGSERIAYLISDTQLCRADGCRERYYDISAQMLKRAPAYDELVKNARQGEPEITDWLEWFLSCVDRALADAEQEISGVVRKTQFMDRFSASHLSERQQSMIDKLLDGVEKSLGSPGRISSSLWAGIAGCSQDTALRDIQDLVERGVLVKEPAGGRSTLYILKELVS
jgi:Fic family protein